MRIVNMDPKLGVSKVVWKFTEKTDADSAESQASPPVEEPHTSPPGNEAMESASVESPGDEEILQHGGHNQAAISPEHLMDLRGQISFLQQVIESQNQQLKTKDELIRNFQVLLKNEQEQVLKLGTETAEKTPAESPKKSDVTWFGLLKSKLSQQGR